MTCPYWAARERRYYRTRYHYRWIRATAHWVWNGMDLGE